MPVKLTGAPNMGFVGFARLRFTAFLLGTTAAALAIGQGVPTDAGRLLQETRPAPGAPPLALPPIKVPETVRPAAPAEGGKEAKVKVSGFKFSGNTAISEAELQAAVATWSGQDLNFGQLVQVTERVEAVYRAAGYFLAQAVLPPQQIRDGVIIISITEGRLGKVRLEGESRISPETMYRYLDRLPQGEVLTEAALERQTLLISELAGGQSALDLQAGSTAGFTDVVLVQRADPLFSGRVQIDNYGLPATGEYRLGLTFNANSPLHLGDRVSGEIIASDTGDLNTYSLRYDLPLGGDGWRTSLTKSLARYSLGDKFSALDADGTADSWRLGVSYPLIRSRAANLRLQLEADTNDLEDNLGAFGLKLDKRSRGITFTPSGDWQDQFLGGGGNAIAMALRHGKLDLGTDATLLDLPPAGPDTEGSFNKLLITLQRRQTITGKLALMLLWRQQITDRNLDSSEKLAVGGAQTLLGYPGGQGIADEGQIAKLDLRWRTRDSLTLGLFTEYAALRLLHDPLAGVDNHAHYADTGFSLDWNIMRRFDLSATLAWATGLKPNPDDNDRPRLWVNLGYNW